MSTKHRVVYLHELPFVIEEEARRGYDRYSIIIFDTRKTRRERVEVRFWKARKMPKRFTCPNCPFITSNPNALYLHRMSKHALEIPA